MGNDSQPAWVQAPVYALSAIVRFYVVCYAEHK